MDQQFLSSVSKTPPIGISNFPVCLFTKKKYHKIDEEIEKGKKPPSFAFGVKNKVQSRESITFRGANYFFCEKHSELQLKQKQTQCTADSWEDEVCEEIDNPYVPITSGRHAEYSAVWLSPGECYDTCKAYFNKLGAKYSAACAAFAVDGACTKALAEIDIKLKQREEATSTVKRLKTSIGELSRFVGGTDENKRILETVIKEYEEKLQPEYYRISLEEEKRILADKIRGCEDRLNSALPISLIERTKLEMEMREIEDKLKKKIVEIKSFNKNVDTRYRRNVAEWTLSLVEARDDLETQGGTVAGYEKLREEQNIDLDSVVTIVGTQNSQIKTQIEIVKTGIANIELYTGLGEMFESSSNLKVIINNAKKKIKEVANIV